VIIAVTGGGIVVIPSLLVLLRLSVAGRLGEYSADGGSVDPGNGRVRTPGLHRARAGRLAIACLVAGFGFLTVAEVGWRTRSVWPCCSRRSRSASPRLRRGFSRATNLRAARAQEPPWGSSEHSTTLPAPAVDAERLDGARRYALAPSAHGHRTSAGSGRLSPDSPSLLLAPVGSLKVAAWPYSTPSISPSATDAELGRRAAAGDAQARRELIERYVPLARRLALRYRSSGEPPDDLIQVASPTWPPEALARARVW
jgi:hypothetical protein